MSQVSELEEKNAKLERHVPRNDGGGGTADTAAAAAHRRARVHVARAAPGEPQVSVTVMVMVECDIVDLVLRVLECLRWMGGVVSVLSVDADTYSPQAMLKALANIKLHIVVLHVCTHRSCMHALVKTSSSTAMISCLMHPPHLTTETPEHSACFRAHSRSVMGWN